ncbi:3'-flap repair endonuclease Xpf [Sulfolobus sp. S-194]|uniref:3'-flap repair endonuclease Xpf n=1 Tax=Sulfolobus sp. S-194 TaxID=2512240 RepID=UPI00256FEFB4|nr:3'-flap repair endonuclease Xpf [Sulfolobus sp. S-194]
MMLRIYVDYREKNSGVPDIIKELGAIVIFDNLSVGDYVISDEIAIERKSVEDLVSSVFDKRFFDQLNRLSEAYAKPFILIEGDMEKIRKITSRWKAINSALTSAILEFDLRVVYSNDRKESAEIIYKIAEKSSTTQNKKIVNLHEKPKFESLRDIQLYVIEAFPQIGSKLAERLLEKFGSIERICNASVSELEKVLESRKKAEEIYKIIHTTYTNKKEERNNKTSLLDFLEPK